MYTCNHQVVLNPNELLSYELPVTIGCNMSPQFKDGLTNWFSMNNESWKFYCFTQKEMIDIENYSSNYLSMMMEALRLVFSSNYEDIKQYFACEMMDKYGNDFFNYAKYTFMQGDASVYGRFDVRFVDGRPDGMYEYNADTPVMLFESLALNHALVCENEEIELNEWFYNTHELCYNMSGNNCVVICDTNSWDDSATAEMVAQALSWPMVDYSILDFDHTNMSQPWVLRDETKYLDKIFALLPWEEMVVKFPIAFKHWNRWANNTTFHEPAWKWFLSHKGMMAYITFLLNEDSGFNKKWNGIRHLETYLSPKKFVNSGRAYVKKPVIGRVSMNISFFDEDNQLIHSSPGGYSDVPMVYQEMAAPGNTGGSNFILGYWTPLFYPSQVSYQTGTLCVREFDTMETDLSNERFCPHMIV